MCDAIAAGRRASPPELHSAATLQKRFVASCEDRPRKLKSTWVGERDAHLQMKDQIDKLEDDSLTSSSTVARSRGPDGQCQVSADRVLIPIHSSALRSKEQMIGSTRSRRCRRAGEPGLASCGLGDPLRPCRAAALALLRDARHSSSISPQANSRNSSRGPPRSITAWTRRSPIRRASSLESRPVGDAHFRLKDRFDKHGSDDASSSTCPPARRLPTNVRVIATHP